MYICKVNNFKFNHMKVSNPKLKELVDAKLDSFITDFYEEIPYGNHFSESENINSEYYTRHTIETILRLRLKRVVDALTIHFFTKTNPRLAKKWAEYTEDEMCHDEWFVADLKKFGVTKEEVYGQEPFLSTQLLQGYFLYGLEHLNSPIINLCSSYFIEYTSSKTQLKWVNNLEKTLGSEKFKGVRNHAEHDDDDDHPVFVWNVIMELAEGDEEAVLKYLERINTLFRMYFTELYEIVVESKEYQPA